MCFYKAKTGEIFSSEELNGKYKETKKLLPWLSPEFYHHKTVEEMGLEEITHSLIKALVMAGRLQDAVVTMVEKYETPEHQARLEVALLAHDIGAA